MPSATGKLYFVLAILGLIITWYFNFQYLHEGGSFLGGAFFSAAFANSLTTSITLDIYWAAMVFSIWAVNESRRLAIRWPWIYIVATFTLALAFSLPLFLAMRERAITRLPATSDVNLS
ncbi:MAG: hypothetical protein Tsb002_21350 [Wenzhouxiangellaceae bacterium]